jgi:hypothetical protein
MDSKALCRDRLLLTSSNLPHASFYENWRAKVPNTLRMREFTGSREAILRVWLVARGTRSSTGTGGEVPINGRKRLGYFRHEGLSRLLPAASRRQVDLPAEASAEARPRYSVSERSASRFSLPQSSTSVSPAWSKHRRQSPVFTRNAVPHCGHSSGSWVIAWSKSVKS